MPLQVTRLGLNEDGSPHDHYHSPDQHAVFTKYVTGVATMTDGTVHNVGGEWTFVDTAEEAEELAHHVSMKLINEGHPLGNDEGPHVVEYKVPAKFSKKGK